MKIEEEKKVMEEEEEEKDEWAFLLPDILFFVCHYHLGIFDFLTCRSVCKTWQSVLSSEYSNITKLNKNNSWLLFYDNDPNSRICYIYEAESSTCCAATLPRLYGSTCLKSKDGWLLCCDDEDDRMFFYNPFRLNTTIDLIPRFPPSTVGMPACSFSFLPDESRCTIAVAWILDTPDSPGSSEIQVNLCRVGDSAWRTMVVKTIKMRSLRSLSFCRCFRPACSCGQTTISMDDYDSRVMFDFETKATKEFPGINRNVWTEYKANTRIEEIFKEDWLSKFGEEGFDISIPPIKRHGRNYFLASCAKRISPSVVDDKRELEMVKATWIEPTLVDDRLNPPTTQ